MKWKPGDPGYAREFLTATARSQARYARAARVLAKITLGEAEAAALAALEQRTGLSAAALVRALILATQSPACLPDSPAGSSESRQA